MNTFIRFSSHIIFVLSLWLRFSQSKLQMQVDVKKDPSPLPRSDERLSLPIRLTKDLDPISTKDHFKNLQFSADSLEDEFKNALFKIDGFNEELIVRLKPDLELLAPTYTTTYVWGNSTRHQKLQPSKSLATCFYKGDVLGKPNSKAVLNICGSLIGSIDTDEHNYVIKPIRNSSTESHDSGSLPHSIQRRSIRSSKSKKAKKSSCGVVEKRNRRKYLQTFKKNAMLEKAQKIAEQASRVSDNLKSNQEDSVKSRSKRSFESRQHFIETLIVADSSMVREHGKDLEHYILSIMMMANKVFAHPSLGSAISLSVVKIMIMEDDGSLQVSSNAAHTLRNFCYWQKQFNFADDTDPRHYDLAVLFTKKDLCGASCDTLGMAEVGAMCSSRHSCAIVEDDGLSSSQTVAHEVGHVLNMMHDDNRLCRKNYASIDSNSHIMSATIARIDKAQPWSRCSRQAVIDFLQDGRGNCLLDKPQQAKVYPSKLPGEMYGVKDQCEMSFGKGARECPYMRECGRLWCQIPTGLRANQCHTRNFPKADGSPCTPGNHCVQGSCVPKTSQEKPVDGKWGSWSQYGTCSRTCGGGIQKATRQCNNPVPQHGGKYCIGSRFQFRSCSIQKCLNSSGGVYADFRSEQCSAYNGQRFPMLGVRVASTWIPKYSDIFEKDRCKLICESVQTGAYITLSDRVIDGTRCGPDTSDICVHGQCMPAGCDGVLGSKAKYNKCGLCNVSNKQCVRVRGKYNKRMSGYNDVITFPKGAASIKVQQRSVRTQIHDGNYLALAKPNGQYILNGGLTLTTMKKDIEYSGTILQYSGVQVNSEKIESTKPLSEPLTLKILSLGISGANILPPRIRYSYYIPRSMVKSRRAKVHNTSRRVKPRSNRRLSRPKPTKLTSTPPNPTVRWVTGRWRKCKVLGNRKCGVGWKKRKVSCKSGKRRSNGCDAQRKPYHRLPCYVPVCPTSEPKRNHGISLPDHNGGPVTVNRNRHHRNIYVWNAGLWSSCSSSCGMGTKRRQVICQTTSGRLMSSSYCNPRMKPSMVNGCKLREC